MSKVIKSFRYAWAGLRKAYRTERNLQIAMSVSMIVILLGILFRITHGDRIVLLIGIGGINAFEMMNTAIERMCDFVHEDYHEKIGAVKDIAAGASLVFITFSAIVGVVVFSHYI